MIFLINKPSVCVVAQTSSTLWKTGRAAFTLLLLRNDDRPVAACQVAPVFVDDAAEVCQKPKQSTASDAFSHNGCDCVTDSNQARARHQHVNVLVFFLTVYSNKQRGSWQARSYFSVFAAEKLHAEKVKRWKLQISRDPECSLCERFKVQITLTFFKISSF